MNTRDRSRRPYWHVDAKWVTGLVLVGVMSLTLSLFGLVRLTAWQPAVDIAGTLLAATFSPLGLDDETEIAAMRATLQASPDGTLKPFPGLQVSIRADQIQDLEPRATRLYVFRQVAEPFYWLGQAALVGGIGDSPMRSDMAAWTSVLTLFTAESHQRLLRALVAFAAACVVLLILLVNFSDRFGRVGSPGVALFVSALPGVSLSALFSARMSAQVARMPPTQGAGILGTAGYLLSTVLPQVMPTLARTYLVVLAIGLGLMLLAVLGNLASRLGRSVSQEDED
jgi:hypothetical protein